MKRRFPVIPRVGRILPALLACLVLFATATRSPAAVRTTTQSGNWSAATTWGGNPAPLSGDDVIVNGNFTVTVDVANGSCLSLQLGGTNSGSGAGTLAFNAGGKLTVFGAVVLGVNNNTPGNLTMTNGGTLNCEGLVENRLGAWTAGTGTVELTATNTIPANTSIEFNHLTLRAGTTSLSRNTTVGGNLGILAGATLACGANILTCAGNWSNNGTFQGGTGQVTFSRDGNATLTGTGINNFNQLRLNMGLSQANTLELLSTQFSAPNGFLQLSNGTLKVSGNFTFANTFVLGTAFNIPPTAGLWLNNPNATVTGQAGSLSLRGLLRVSAGTVNVGTAANHSLVYQNDGSAIIVDGGALDIAGRLSGNNATATTSYTQSGGTVTVVRQGSTDPAFGGFDISVAGSAVTLSGGTIVVRHATSGPAEFINVASTGGITGGLLQLGDALTGNAETFRIHSSRPVGNLLVSNATPQAVKPKVQLNTSSLNVVGTLTLPPGTALDAGGLNIAVGGDFVNNAPLLNLNTVTFNGGGAQTLTNPAGAIFNTLAVNKSGGAVTLNSATTVGAGLNLFQGTLALGAQTLTLEGDLTLAGGTLAGGATSSLVVGGAAGPLTLPGLVLSSLTLNRAAGATLAGDVTVGGALTVTSGPLSTDAFVLTLGPVATLSEPAGAPVQGAIQTTRTLSATAGTETFGGLGADLLLNGAAPGVTTVVRRVSTAATGNGHSSIQRTYDITPTTNYGLNAGLVFHYDTSDLAGQTEAALRLFRSRNGGGSWNDMAGVVNVGTGTITVAGLNDFSRWTASDAANSLGPPPAPATAVRVESAPDGSGVVVPAQSLAAGATLHLYAITRDAANDYVASVPAASWALEAITGGVLPGDLAPAADLKSAVFTAHAAGSARVRATVAGLAATTSGVLTVNAASGVEVGDVPLRFELAQNYPNPFRGSTTIRFQMARPGRTRLTVFDVLGRAVTTLVSREESPGVHAVDWDASGVQSGVYFYRLELNGEHQVRRMFILK